MNPKTLYGRTCLAICLALILGATGCVVGGLSPSTEPSTTQPGEIPFDLAGPGGMAVVVSVKIDGQGPYRFVVDTGATFTCVDQELADRLKLETKPGAVGFGSGIESSGATRLVTIDSLELGTASAQDVTAAVIDLRNFKSVGLDIHGLIGLNFLKSYRVTFDFDRNTLKLQDPRSAG